MKRNKASGTILLVVIFAVAMFISTDSYSLTTVFESEGNYKIYAKGVGLNNPSVNTTSGNIQLNITGTPVKAYLYWIERDLNKNGVDNTITFQKSGSPTIDITGNPTSDRDNYCFRADITNYVTAGVNSFTLSGLNNERNPGAGILVIVEDINAPLSEVIIKDGCDFFFYGISGQENSEVISFNFEPVPFNRSGSIIFFVGDAQTETETIRGNEVLYLPSDTVPTATPSYPLTSPPAISLGKNQTGLVANDGKNWDTFGRDSGILPPIINFPPTPYDDPDQRSLVTVPSGKTYANFQLLSSNKIQHGISAIISTAAFQLILDREGCTPGYWKQPQHFGSWTFYSPDMKFSDVFGKTITIMWNQKGKPQSITNPTLLQALEANGGGINALARQAVAALLNAASPLVHPDPAFDTPAEVIAAVQSVLNTHNTSDDEALKNKLDSSNNAGCPLN
jgi:hypothetical protein